MAKRPHGTRERRSVRDPDAAPIADPAFRRFVEHLGDALFVLRLPARRILYANSAAARMFGFSRSELVGSSTERLHASREHFLRFDELSLPDLRSDRPYYGEFVMRRKNGETFPTSHMVTLIEDEAGRTYAVSVVRDETASKIRERELLQAQKSEALGRLIGGIAHDFNNLLNVILGYGEMLTESLPTGSEYRDDARRILAAAESAAALTRRLLSFARRHDLDIEVLDLNALVGEVVDNLLARTLGGDIAIHTDLGPDLWLLEADRTLLETGIVNLAINARDAMPDGGVLTIRTGNRRVDEREAAMHPGLSAGDYVELSVADTGVGMPQAVLAQIFDPFFSTKPPGKGTGLGLSVLHGFVRQLGGHVAVSSEPGAGARFDVLLPRFVADVPTSPSD